MRASRVVPFVVVLLGLLLLVPRLAWWDRDPIEVALGVAGPPPGRGASHPPKGLTWILQHIKAYRAHGEDWGLFPGELNPAVLRGLAAVYMSGSLPSAMSSRGVSDERPGAGARMTGWVRASDGRALTAFTSKGGMAIAEGGLLATLQDSEAQWRVEDCFRVRWTGWVGLSVDDIGDPSQTPRWLLERLERAGEMTPAGGPAVILIKGERALVLREELELNEHVHEIVRLAPSIPILEGNVSARVPYRGWFDVLQARGGGEVLAEHRLDVTDWGAQKLAGAGLSRSFPCIVRYSGAYVSYYLAGAFSQDGPNEFWAKMAGYPSLASLVARKLGKTSNVGYWDLYFPLMRYVISETAGFRGSSGS